MKKLVLGAALAVSSLTFAQQFGAKAGVNVTSLGSNSELDSKSKAGFYAGVFMNAPLASSFSIQPEVLYENAGAKSKLSNDIKLNLDYIAVPVMFQYNVTPEFYLEAGPKFSFLVNTKVKADDSLTETTLNDMGYGNKDNYNTFDFGLGLGAGYYFTPNIGVGVRYVAGLTDIRKNNEGDAVRNGAFQAGLNFKF